MGPALLLILVSVIQDGLETVVIRLSVTMIVLMVVAIYQTFVHAVLVGVELIALMLYALKTVVVLDFALDLITVPV